jgi:two-component system, chemotaxis family, CheB/CheR fusion protein
MTEELRPDGAETDLADQIDDIVPSYGYGKVPVVGLGGSAGSIEALQDFFTTMPSQSGLAFVVVIHLSPEHDSMLTDVLQRCTRMRVVKVVDTLKVEPNHVYVIPPGKVLQSRDGELRLQPTPPGRAGHVVVDVFFRTLADSHGAHAAAIVLSGMDGDGAIGIKRIKERGGLTVAQDPDQAAHPSMPRHAIDTGMVDWVLPVHDMPSRLLAYFRLEQAVNLPPEEPDEGELHTDEASLRDVLNFLRTRTGRDFSHYKRATVLRRIGRRMQVNGVDNLPSYLNCLRTRTGECGALLQDLLISVTNFFRDPECFHALEEHIPSLFAGKGPNDAVRVWVVACATGEEAYSLAMLLAEHARTLEAPPLIQVFATDLDEQAVRVAREAVYPLAVEADVSEERLRRYFLKEHHGYRVRRELRELVLFAVHDVLLDSPFSRQDLVSCRNLLIYLTRDSQKRVMETLHFALLPTGKLFLGSSESLDDESGLFTVLDKKNRIYVQRPSTRIPLSLPQAASTLTRSAEAQHAAVAGPVTAGRSFNVPVASNLADAAPAGIEPRRPGAWGELHLQLLERLAPPSVLVNADHDIVHLSPSAGRFLQLAGGEPSRNLMRAVSADVRIDLRAALYQAGEEAAEVSVPPVAMPLAGGTMLVGLRIVPVTEAREPLFLVVFEVQPTGAESAEAREKRHAADPLARYLDAEIERLKSHLRETVEQYEASTEELKASNEELQAMNEEMRAATEELETSREELQSINEELSTVNSELKAKVDQLSGANSDMQNLMDATRIATIFLDRELRITRFTPAAVKLFKLLPGDLGRPLTDLATDLVYPDLGADAAEVLERLVPIEREVGQSNGEAYLARMMPYRTHDDRIAGVVFTFIEITERKRGEEMRRWLAAVVSSTADAIISFALDQTILSWNTGAQRLFGYGADEAIGKPMSLLAADGGSEEQAHMVEEVAAGRGVENLETVRRRKDGSRVHVAITVSPIHDAGGHVQAGTAIVRDVSAARRAAQALRESEERLRLIIESAVEYAIFSTDLERRITSWNSGAERLLGYDEKEVMGKTADIIFTPEDRERKEPEKEARTARREGRSSDERMHMRKDGSRFRGTGIMMLMRNEAGDPVGLVKILRDLSRPEPEPS